MGKRAVAVLLLAVVGVVGCGDEQPRASLVIFDGQISANPRVHVYLASTGEAMAIWMNKFEMEFMRFYWGRWTTRGTDYVLAMSEMQRLERPGGDEVAGNVTMISPPLRIELVQEKPEQCAVRCDGEDDMHGLTVFWSAEKNLTEEQLRTEFHRLRPGVQEEIGIEDGK